jgi:hypothetical protein
MWMAKAAVALFRNYVVAGPTNWSSAIFTKLDPTP